MNNLLKLFLLNVLFSSICLAQTKGWGYNSEGELGIGNKSPQPIPQTITAVPDATAVSGGLSHTLFLKADGTVLAAGFNNQNQLGDGTNIKRLTPVVVKKLANVVQISSGWDYSVALKADGTVWSWGSNSSGQIGNGSILTELFSEPTETKISDVVQISSGLYHTLALKSDGTVWAWGFNREGQLGNGTTTENNDTPIQVGAGIAGFNNIISIAAGRYHSLALKADGTVWQWGKFYIIKDKRVVIVPFPEQNTALTNISQVATKTGNNAVLKADGTVWEWGSDLNGKIEYLSIPKGSYATITTIGCKCFETPTKVPIENVVEIKALGSGDGKLARKRDGSVWSWGENIFGELGIGITAKTAGFIKSSPVQTLAGKGNALIEAGFYSGFAAKPSFTTLEGENVQQYGENVTLNFSKVIKSGATSYIAIDPTATRFTAPKSLSILPNSPAYDIKTTAELSGDIVLCIKVPTVYDEDMFSKLHLLQNDNANLVDRTFSSDYRTRTLCAKTDSLSQFLIAK